MYNNVDRALKWLLFIVDIFIYFREREYILLVLRYW